MHLCGAVITLHLYPGKDEILQIPRLVSLQNRAVHSSCSRGLHKYDHVPITEVTKLTLNTFIIKISLNACSVLASYYFSKRVDVASILLVLWTDMSVACFIQPGKTLCRKSQLLRNLFTVRQSHGRTPYYQSSAFHDDIFQATCLKLINKLPFNSCS